MYFHIFICAGFGTLYFLKNKLPLKFKSYSIVVGLTIVGIGGVIVFGLTGAGTLILVGTVILAQLFVGVRGALSIIVLSVIAMGWQLYSTQYGLTIVSKEQSEALAWINNITAFLYISGVSVYCIHYFLGFLTELSNQLRNELMLGHKQLQDSEVLLSTVLNSLTFGVMWKDKHFRFRGCNKQFLNDLGLHSVNQVIGKTDYDFAEREVAERYREQDRQVFTSGEPMLHVVEEYDRANDAKLYLIIHRVPLRNAQGEIDGVLVSYSDITQTKTLENQLREAKLKAEEASEAKSSFLATMSHEIRTPINGVMGLLELALETDLNAKQREYLTKAEYSAETLLHIINQILDISKIESGKIELERVPFVLADVMQRVQLQLGHMAKKKDLVLNIKGLGSVECPALGDPTRLIQIIINLCSNALKFTESGSVNVTIAALEQKETLNTRIEVSDSGIGIPKDKLSMLFESFTQADSSTSRRYGGTGLGLAIVKQLVELQGGTIEIDSECDVGTTVTCFLKFDICSQEFDRSNQDKQTSLSGVRVLIAEDNSINQLIVREILEQEGAVVFMADDGNQAISCLEENPVDVVLMDIQMPNMDGKMALQHIRSKQKWGHLPVVALTANVLSHEVMAYKALGFDSHLGKPFQKEQLLRVVDNMASRTKSPV